MILTNTTSLHSMVMYGRGITDEKQFLQGVLTHMGAFMTIDGNMFVFQKYIEPLAKEITFSKIVDRQVMGSMNDLVFQAKIHINPRKSPFDVLFLLNETPMSYLKYHRPKDVFRVLNIEEI